MFDADRPDKMNALNGALITALCETIQTFSADTSLRAIVLTGAGRAFCGGVDLREVSEAEDGAAAVDWLGEHSRFELIRSCPVPMISAVNGFAITGGLELALMGDFILAGESARFADTHARVGITPSWGMTQVLPRLIGRNRARQMSLTGAFIDAPTACDWGLVNEVVPDDTLISRAMALAVQIAETDPLTMGRIRTLIAKSAETTLDEGLAHEAAVFQNHIATVTGAAISETRRAVTDRGRRLNRDA